MFRGSLFLALCCFSLQLPAQAIKKEVLVKGKQVFNTYCLPCHQEDGSGVPGLNPPLIKTSYVLGDKRKLIGIVLNGFQENVEINGEHYSNVMAPHDFLTDDEVASVLTYVRNSFGNKATPVTASEVKAIRNGVKK